MSEQTSVLLKQEIASLSERRAGLAAELEKANQVNDEAQTELVATGSSDAMKAATVAHARSSALQHAVATLDNTLEGKQRELEDAETYERNEANRVRAAECLREIDEKELELSQVYTRMHEPLVKEAPLAVAIWSRIRELRTEYGELARVTGSAPLSNRIDSMENLAPFGSLVEQVVQWQANLNRRGTPAERKAKLVERSKAASEAAQRQDEEKAARELEASKVNESGWVTIAADRNPLKAA